MAVPNSNFASDFIASTLKYFEKSLRSHILQQSVALSVLKERAMDEVDGGEELAYPQLYDDNDSFKSYSQDGDLDLSMQTGLTIAQYPWRQYAGSVVISGMDLFRNGMSKAKIVNLLEAKTKQLSESVTYKLITDLFSAQSGTNIQGLPDLVASSSNTVGGIDSSTYTWWANNNVTTATFGTTVNGNGFQHMQNMMKDCSENGKTPDIIMTTARIHSAIELALMNNRYFVRGDSKDKWGFDSIPFKGADIYWDDQCVSGSLFFINSDDLRLVFGKGANFSLQNKVEPANKDIKVWLYLTYLQLVAKKRRSHGLIYGMTSA